jgi:hypothetical protein
LSGARIRSPDAEYAIGVALGLSTFTATVVDETVVVKATSLRSGGWRALDTWEATRGVLKALSHPSLPPLLDAAASADAEAAAEADAEAETVMEAAEADAEA